MSDRLFRYTFKRREVAEAELRYNLPAELVAAVDWSTLRYEPDIVVDPERETRKDVLLSARLVGSSEEDPPHFFLIEHQSKVQRLMARRLHDYAKRVVDHWFEEHPKSRRIAELTALVVYTKRGRRWWAPRRLEDLYGPAQGSRPWGHKGLAIGFGYEVDDMPAFSDLEVLERPGPALGPLVLLVLSFAGTQELAQRLPYWRELFAEVYAEPNGLRVLYRVLYFLLQRGERAAYEAAREVVYSLMEKEKAERLMRTMADVFRAEGRREGRVKGRAEGLAKALLKLLAARGLHVDDSSRQVIERCKDPVALERWLDRALVATRLADVLDSPAQ